jgi:hypothetical protein
MQLLFRLDLSVSGEITLVADLLSKHTFPDLRSLKLSWYPQARSFDAHELMHFLKQSLPSVESISLKYSSATLIWTQLD